ncbi:MAG: ROK family protein [Wenzhouxiangellaceae bacterium]|nr:ROK family protein [Wenzhouxiangellaceae bacterium]
MSRDHASNRQIIGGIEAGGTKFVCAVAINPARVLDRHTVVTTTPDATLAEVVEFFRSAQRRFGRLRALGVASFGPVELDLRSPDYGSITQTPKAHWNHVPLVSRLREALDVPVGFDTDVNGAALGEGRDGAAAGLDHYIYVTVGTGIGAGLVSSGRLVHGKSHPEVGHMLVPRHPDDDYRGACRFHGPCLEGLASAPALRARWDCDPAGLPDDHPAWALQTHYLAAMCHNLTSLFAPQRIIVGGGVMLREGLYENIRQNFLELAGGYFSWISADNVDHYIAAPGHAGRSGEIGALILAERAFDTG